MILLTGNDLILFYNMGKFYAVLRVTFGNISVLYFLWGHANCSMFTRLSRGDPLTLLTPVLE